jgi:hypothetical protein
MRSIGENLTIALRTVKGAWAFPDNTLAVEAEIRQTKARAFFEHPEALTEGETEEEPRTNAIDLACAIARKWGSLTRRSGK